MEIMVDDIVETIPQLIQNIGLLEELRAEKENERQALESQNQKLRYRLKFLKEVSCNSFMFVTIFET